MFYKQIDSVFNLKKFPVEDCLIQDKKEKQLKNSNIKYLCLVVDKRFPEERNIKILSPYTWEENGELSYAWVDKDGNWIDNFENPVHGYIFDEFAIGWLPYEEDEEYLKELKNKFEN